MMKPGLAFFLQGAALASLAAGSLFAAAPRAAERYCNPLPIPNYPVGKLARDITKGEPNDGGLWFAEKKEQYRELAVPTALWFEGAWYLYSSCDMAWVKARPPEPTAGFSHGKHRLTKPTGIALPVEGLILNLARFCCFNLPP